MDHLSGLGIFLGGLGFLLLSCAAMWWISLYAKINESKLKDKK